MIYMVTTVLGISCTYGTRSRPYDRRLHLPCATDFIIARAIIALSPVGTSLARRVRRCRASIAPPNPVDHGKQDNTGLVIAHNIIWGVPERKKALSCTQGQDRRCPARRGVRSSA